MQYLLSLILFKKLLIFSPRIAKVIKMKFKCIISQIRIKKMPILLLMVLPKLLINY